ncbi:MAG: BspA family leucine-rich repeat surface protein [Salinispira sp.]
MNIKLYTGIRFLFCAMCIALLAACPMPEPGPTVPGKIGAPDLEAGNEQLIATWTAPNNGGSEITTYHLHHSADGGTTWSEIIVLAAPAANYSITGLRNAAEYHVQARAVNAVGAGPWSESAVATLPPTATLPATVPDAPAAPTLYAGTGRIVARWSAPEDNGSAITGYELQYRAGGGAWTEITEGITGTDHTITGLTNGTPYQVQARAVNAVVAGDWSEIAIKTPTDSVTQTPMGEEVTITPWYAFNAIVTAIIANENLSVFVTTVESGTFDFDEGDLKVKPPATAPAGVTIPTVDANTGIVTVTASTTAGTYVVYGETESGDIVFAEYLYVIVSPDDAVAAGGDGDGDGGKDELAAAVTAAIGDYNDANDTGIWGNTADLNYIITTAVTDMSEIFAGQTAFNGNISGWDVSSVTAIESMFISASTFNGDISGWDVSSVTNMIFSFANASAFNGDISGWDVSSVTNMSNMFNAANKFNSDISGWDVQLVTDMSSMFKSASAFNQNLEEWGEHLTLNTDTPPKYTGNKTDMFKDSGVNTTNGNVPSWY